jgi:hypothetical protein
MVCVVMIKKPRHIQAEFEILIHSFQKGESERGLRARQLHISRNAAYRETQPYHGLQITIWFKLTLMIDQKKDFRGTVIQNAL